MKFGTMVLLMAGIAFAQRTNAQQAAAPQATAQQSTAQQLTAQQLTAQPTHARQVQPVRETVTVLGQIDPIAVGQSARSTATIPVQPQRLTVDTPADLLREDPSVDIEQRGGGGVQDDVSIRGSSYEQTLVLLNGLRINDAETSHFNLDVPVPLDALGSIDVLHGAGSTLYGSDAVSGVVDLQTIKPAGEGLGLRLRAGGGSFGGNTQAFVGSFVRGDFSEVAAGGRDFSTGFIADRDFRSEEASSETRGHSFAGDSDVLLAGSDRAFGAAGFYGDYPSFEHTKGWFAAITQQFDAKTSASLAYRRHTDIFVLFRDDPSLYENQHIDTSWQGVVRHEDDLSWQHTHLDYGLDINADQIDSTNLGLHGRNRGAGYLNARFAMGKRGTLSVGLRDEVFDGGRNEAVPAFSASKYIGENVKLRGAISRGFRLPTYTDLYYTDPTDIGNPNLKPESAWSYEGGADWYPSPHWALSATGYTSHQTDVIDYVRPDASQPYHAENLTHVELSGAELSAEWRLAAGQQVRFGLTTVSGASAALNGEQSKYAFNYPIENGLMEWESHWKNGLTLHEQMRVVNRIDRSVYPVLDSSVAYDGWRVHPYLQMTNLNNASYQEVIGVPMQGRAFAAGVEVQLGARQ